MKVEFLSFDEIDELHSSGETVVILQRPYPEGLGEGDLSLSANAQTVETEEPPYYGRFAFDSRRFLVEEDLSSLWLEKIGADFEWQP